ncbi:hypothetical protein BLX41_13700 [Pseudomonas protegens]|uniref:hypothetical protein n=1 Tax=Pseudomonas protegens TaxID=380021 RepID=UPI000F4C0099|nr:hypothetical protein [Pseudomonas protegens]ROL76921.1 hypothetical protein BLX41_13700 [Pseudomonas protegens]
MANEDPKAVATILSFAETYLKRPLTVVERQVLEAFVQNKSVDLVQASQNSIDQARQRALDVIQADEQRTRQLIEQLAGPAAPGPDNPQTRDLLLQQLLSAAGAQAQVQAPASAPAPTPASPPPAPADDPALKALIGTLVQQEVKAAIEARMAELAQKVEDTLKQVTAGTGQ